MPASAWKSKARVSNFVLVPSSSKCPKCEGLVTLLQHLNTRGPQFYICFPCESVYQIGVGEVKQL